MSSINNVVLVGNTTRDSEVKYVGSGTAVVNTSLALNRKYKDQEEVTFVDVVFFGKLAEIVGEYVTKGQQIAVTGRLKQETWETEGQKRSKLVVVAENMQMLSSKKGEAVASKANSEAAASTNADPDSVPF